MKNLIVCSFFLLISAFANGQISVMPYFRIDKSNLVQSQKVYIVMAGHVQALNQNQLILRGLILTIVFFQIGV